MCLSRFCRTVRDQVRELGTYLWEEESRFGVKEEREALESRCAELTAEISRRRGLAARYRAELVEIRRRLVAHEKKASSLKKRIEILHRVGDQANAWTHALELEQLRQLIYHECGRLHTQERIYQEHLVRLDWLKERLAELQELVVT